MSALGWARLVFRVGRITEPAPPLKSVRPNNPVSPEPSPTEPSPTEPSPLEPQATDSTEAVTVLRELRRTTSALGGSVQVRHVDAGSCNGCEIEIGAAFGPVYDVERFGVRLVASPRHADALLVTGAVTHNLAEPLRRTVAATPRPRVVLAVGDCARNCGVFAGAYGVVGAVSEVVDVDVEVAGCPPEPAAIVAALRQVSGR